MSSRSINRDQAREVDHRATEEYGIPSIVLMENAGRGVADKLCELGIERRVVVCCGSGNNGGDGFVVARHLDIRGIAVRVLLFAAPESLRGDAALNYRILTKTDLPIDVMSDARGVDAVVRGASWAVDALLGTGSRGEPRSPLDAVIDCLNAAKCEIVAIDLPSGMDCDTGAAAAHTIRAAHTCTFIAAKAGFRAPGAEQYTGQVHVLDIGAPRKLVDEVLTTSLGDSARPE